MLAKRRTILFVATALFSSLSLGTPDLLETVQSSVDYDPTYLNTVQTNNSTVAAVGVSRAALLPQLSGTVSKNWSWSKDSVGNGFTTSSNKIRSVGLSLTQSIFNFSNYKTLASSQVSAMAAKLSTRSAYQSLLQTVGVAYFNLASAQAVLAVDEQLVTVDEKLLRLSRAQYKAGQVLASDVLTSQASVLSAKQTVINQKQTIVGYQNALAEHTPQSIDRVRGLVGQLTVKKPKRSKLKEWVKRGMMVNPAVLEKKLSVLAAKKTLQAEKAMLLPSVSASYSYSGSNATYLGAQSVVQPSSEARSSSFGLTMSVPLYQGGQVYATIKQDTYSYMAAKDSYREQQKTVESGIDTNFRSMGLEIDNINSLKKSTKVYHKNYLAMLQAYKVGKETMTDVQSALTNYYSQKSSLVQAEYTFLTDYLTFKQDVGTLSLKDIVAINNWMHKHVQS